MAPGDGSGLSGSTENVEEAKKATRPLRHGATNPRLATRSAPRLLHLVETAIRGQTCRKPLPLPNAPWRWRRVWLARQGSFCGVSELRSQAWRLFFRRRHEPWPNARVAPRRCGLSLPPTSSGARQGACLAACQGACRGACQVFLRLARLAPLRRRQGPPTPLPAFQFVP